MKEAPYQPELQRASSIASASSASLDTGSMPSAGVSTDWREGLPVLAGLRVRMREVRVEDAAALFTMLATEEVARFITPPPATIDGFERFIGWAQEQRRRGEYACFAVVPEGMDTAVGIFQVRSLEPGFGTAEWGFVVGASFWGTGVFAEGARMMLNFAFDIVGIHRLEARAAVANGRGNGALRKLGAVQEGLLRRSFARNGAYHDQVLWSILAEDWQFMRLERRPRIH